MVILSRVYISGVPCSWSPANIYYNNLEGLVSWTYLFEKLDFVSDGL